MRGARCPAERRRLNSRTSGHKVTSVMLKRISIHLLAVVLVIATTVQAIPRASVAAPEMAMAGMDMSGASHRAPPCKGMTPACTDCLGCATAGLPATPVLVSAPIVWGELRYAPIIIALTGRTIRPELFPPILRA